MPLGHLGLRHESRAGSPDPTGLQGLIIPLSPSAMSFKPARQCGIPLRIAALALIPGSRCF
ncbi:hypothetical protein BVG79_01222 [Ketogulonicigenium robustum]|uniref:Uncharacterized protein n=1 Tax=Ketogulonicigenium robustum TaxID=92947 RepID=A0A1W6NZ87_9RHOB|nr:hypothetical protein BVG79_01222 [Ketogulonicigenium robustum]